MLGWIERVVPQPPAPRLTGETPPAPVRDPEPAKVSREPVWGVPGTPRAKWRDAQCLCIQPRHCGTQGCSAASLGGMGARMHPPSELLGGSRKVGESLGFAATFEWGTQSPAPHSLTPSAFYPEGPNRKGRWPRGCC